MNMKNFALQCPARWHYYQWGAYFTPTCRYIHQASNLGIRVDSVPSAASKKLFCIGFFYMNMKIFALQCPARWHYYQWGAYFTPTCRYIHQASNLGIRVDSVPSAASKKLFCIVFLHEHEDFCVTMPCSMALLSMGGLFHTYM